MNYVPDFVVDAMNVYRTRNYIVKQSVGIKCSEVENNVVLSHDTFYRRTKKRDREYELIFAERKHIDGKRIHSTMYGRTYVD